MDVTAELACCRSRSSTTTFFGRIKNVLSRSIDQYRDAAAILTEHDRLANYLTENELSEALVDTFSAVSPLNVITVISSYLRTSKPSPQIFTLVERIVPSCVDTVLLESVESNPEDDVREQDLVEWCKSLSALPDLLLSTHIDRRASGIVRSLTSSVNQTLVKCIRNSVDSIRNGNSVNLRIVTRVVQLCRNFKDENGVTLLSLLCSSILDLPVCPLLQRVCERVFTDQTLGSRHIESLTQELISLPSIQTTDHLMIFLGVSASRSSSVTRRVCQRLLLQRCPSPAVTSLVIDYLHKTLNVEVFNKLITDALDMWADVVCVSQGDAPILRHRTRVVLVLIFVSQSEEEVKKLFHNMFPTIAQGISAYLARPETYVRQLGMLVGEETAKLLEHDELKFDYEPDDFTEEMRTLLRGDKLPERKAVKNTVPCFVPDYPVSKPSTSALQQQSIDSDDEDFPAYEIPEEELKTKKSKSPSTADPEKWHPAPFYLRECLEWLDEKEKYEKWEAAFRALPDLIRKRALGFDEESERILTKLIYLEDKFCTKGFEEVRCDAICAALSARPSLVPLLADTLYSSSCNMTMRYQLLECVAKAAEELSKLKRPDILRDPKPDSNSKAPEWRSLIKRPCVPESHSSNPLHPSLDLFVYPLLRTQVHGAHLQLMGRNSVLLAKSLFTVSQVLTCAQNAPSLPRISSAVSEVVDLIAGRPEPLLRSSALFTRLVLSQSLPPEVFVQLFASRARVWVEWAASLADDVEATNEHREIAAQVAAQIAKAVKQSGFAEEDI